MAIKFVDIGPEDGKSKKAAPAQAKPQAETDAAKGAVKPADPEDGWEPAPEPRPELPFAKSEPKARGRKKPLK